MWKDAQMRRVGKGALAPCPPFLAPWLMRGGHAALCPPYKNNSRERNMPAAFFVVRATVTDPAKREALLAQVVTAAAA